MSMDELLEMIRFFDGVLELAPDQNSAFPAIAWGDHFIYYAPDGQVPKREQPFATIVTKNYPDDALSDLDAADRWRLNIHVGTDVFTELLGEAPARSQALGTTPPQTHSCPTPCTAGKVGSRSSTRERARKSWWFGCCDRLTT